MSNVNIKTIKVFKKVTDCCTSWSCHKLWCMNIWCLSLSEIYQITPWLWFPRHSGMPVSVRCRQKGQNMLQHHFILMVHTEIWVCNMMTFSWFFRTIFTLIILSWYLLCLNSWSHKKYYGHILRILEAITLIRPADQDITLACNSDDVTEWDIQPSTWTDPESQNCVKYNLSWAPICFGLQWAKPCNF